MQAINLLIRTQLSMSEDIMCGEFLKHQKSILVLGGTGCGKSAVAQYLAANFPFLEKKNQFTLEGRQGHSTQNLHTLRAMHEDENETPFLMIEDIDEFDLSFQERIMDILGHKKKLSAAISTAHPGVMQKVRRGQFRFDLFNRIRNKTLALHDWQQMPAETRQALILAYLEELEIEIPTFKLMHDLTHVLLKDNFHTLLAFLKSIQGRKSKRILQKDILPMKKENNKLNRAHAPSSALSWEDHDLAKIRQFGLKKFLKEMERDLINLILDKNQRQVRKTIQFLKMSNTSFYRTIKLE